MTSISAVSSTSSSYPATESADAVAGRIAGTAGTPDRPQGPPQGPPPGPPPGGAKGENSFLRDDSKVSRISDLLDVDPTELTGQATSAASLVSMLQDKGVDATQLRNVLSSGDLLDVAA